MESKSLKKVMDDDDEQYMSYDDESIIGYSTSATAGVIQGANFNYISEVEPTGNRPN